MSQRILLTGSSGTVGTALTQRLLAQGHKVVPLDIRKSFWDPKIDRKTVRCDLRKPIKDKRLVGKKFDLIMHLAANARVHDLVVKPDMSRDNYLMVHNLLEYARSIGCRRFVFSSSREVYGDSVRDQKRKENSTHVSAIKAPYTASKFAAEAMIHAYRECYGIDFVIARLSNVYGMYDVSERVIPLFLYYALRDRTLTIFGKEKKLDFTYIDDCIDGLEAIVERFDRVCGNTFNICGGKGERLLDLAKYIVAELDSDSRIEVSSRRTGEISTFVGDLSLSRRKLGYKPRTRLIEGVARTAEWYREVIKSRPIRDWQRRNLAGRGWA